MDNCNSVDRQTTGEFKKPYKEKFFIIPMDVHEMDGMTYSYAKVYQAIFQFWNKDRECWLSEKALCDRTGLGKAQVYKALTFFESGNKLIREYRDGRRYLVNPEANTEAGYVGGDVCSSDGEPPDQRLLQENNTSPVGDHNIKKESKEDHIYNMRGAPLSAANNENDLPPALRKREHRETLFPAIVDKKIEPAKSSAKRKPLPAGLDVEDLIEPSINPHAIPEDMIGEWLAVMKFKRKLATVGVWTYLNEQLSKCNNPLKAFKMMLGHSWMTLNDDFIESLNKTKSKDATHAEQYAPKKSTELAVKNKPAKKKARPTGLATKDLVEAEVNEHAIPKDLIDDWLIVRASKNKPVTKTAWRSINKQLSLCDDPIEAFETMVTCGWVSLKHEWIKNINKSKSKESHFDHDDTSWADSDRRSMFE